MRVFLFFAMRWARARPSAEEWASGISGNKGVVLSFRGLVNRRGTRRSLSTFADVLLWRKNVEKGFKIGSVNKRRLLLVCSL
jgi:hypothetical protein